MISSSYIPRVVVIHYDFGHGYDAWDRDIGVGTLVEYYRRSGYRLRWRDGQFVLEASHIKTDSQYV